MSFGLSFTSDVIPWFILNFCRRKTSFQWCSDQGDWQNGAGDMHKNAQNVTWKTQRKSSCHYTWLLYRKNCPSRWPLLKSVLTESKPIKRSIPTAKRKEEKEIKEKKFKNRKALRHHLKISKFWPRRMPEPVCHKTRCQRQERQAVVLQIHFRPD